MVSNFWASNRAALDQIQAVYLVLEELGIEESENGGARVTIGKRMTDRMRVRAVNELFGKRCAFQKAVVALDPQRNVRAHSIEHSV